MREVPLGWRKWERFENTYITDDEMSVLFISKSIEKNSISHLPITSILKSIHSEPIIYYRVDILKEKPVDDEYIRGFDVVHKEFFKTLEDAEHFARMEMMRITAENRVRQKYSRKKKIVRPKSKRCRCKK